MAADAEQGSRGETLSSLAATSGDRSRAFALVLVSAIAFAALVPFAQQPLAAVHAFIPGYQAALVMGDLITASLLFAQLQYSRSRALLVLACGYLFTGAIAIAHALTFPGLFVPGGLLGAGPQSTAWLYMFWHAGFPLCVIGYAVLKGSIQRPGTIGLGVALSIAAALAFTALATSTEGVLPPIMRGNQYLPAMSLVVGSVWALSFVALIVLWMRRVHTVLDVWLLVVMCAWIFDIALSAVLNAGRFDVGFYAGRAYGLLAAILVLVVLLFENARLYRRLVEHTTQLDAARRRAMQAERTKGNFLATMSHEIRTPMNGVMGMLELLALTRLDGDQRTKLGVIRESGRSLLRILDDILDISKIEAGKVGLRLEPTSIAAVVERVRAIHAANAASKGVQLAAVVDERISPSVMADPLRLGQILNNLVSNAVKFTTEGAVTLRAGLVERAEDREVVRLTVEDTGCGIAAQDLFRLFEPFAQASQNRSGGTGLGLSISRRLAELMQGRVYIESKPGEGTKAILEIALQVSNLAPRQIIAAVEEARSIANHAPTVAEARAAASLILVVDDHPINRMLLEQQLNALGYGVETARDGLEAMERLKAGGFGAVLTDCYMPGMDGYALARHIRAREAAQGSARIPVIACTANAMEGDAAECLAAGMDDVLAKPVGLAELLRKLQAWIPKAGPLDRDALQVLSSGDEGKELEILSQFRRYGAEDAHALKAAIESKDAARIAAASHRIKSSSLCVGAMALADVSSQIEKAARANDTVAACAGLARFDRELGRLNAHIVVMESRQ